MAATSYLPDDLLVDLPASPIGILDEVASEITVKSRGLAEASLKTQTEEDGFLLTFRVELPALGYEWIVGTYRIPIAQYPVKRLEWIDDYDGYYDQDSFQDEGNFRSHVSWVFSGDEFLSKLKGLLSAAVEKSQTKPDSLRPRPNTQKSAAVHDHIAQKEQEMASGAVLPF